MSRLSVRDLAVASRIALGQSEDCRAAGDLCKASWFKGKASGLLTAAEQMARTQTCPECGVHKARLWPNRNDRVCCSQCLQSELDREQKQQDEHAAERWGIYGERR